MSPQLIRYPLETLSLDAKRDQNDEESELRPLRRLVRERPKSLRDSPPKREQKNALDMLRLGALRVKRHYGTPMKLMKSEFVEAEAQESDDELLPGFGGVRGDDDEAENETPDAVVEGLVDDGMVDENLEKVLEKH